MNRLTRLRQAVRPTLVSLATCLLQFAWLALNTIWSQVTSTTRRILKKVVLLSQGAWRFLHRLPRRSIRLAWHILRSICRFTKRWGIRTRRRVQWFWRLRWSKLGSSIVAAACVCYLGSFLMPAAVASLLPTGDYVRMPEISKVTVSEAWGRYLPTPIDGYRETLVAEVAGVPSSTKRSWTASDKNVTIDVQQVTYSDKSTHEVAAITVPVQVTVTLKVRAENWHGSDTVQLELKTPDPSFRPPPLVQATVSKQVVTKAGCTFTLDSTPGEDGLIDYKWHSSPPLAVLGMRVLHPEGSPPLFGYTSYSNWGQIEWTIKPRSQAAVWIEAADLADKRRPLGKSSEITLQCI